MPDLPAAAVNAVDPLLALCQSVDVLERGHAVPFDVVYAGQTCRAFAVRFNGQVVAYLNRCSHVAMEMDWKPNRFFDDTGRWLLCATHGATYEPGSGACAGGPCRGGLTAVPVLERDGVVYWQAQYPFSQLIF
ncbi:2Fe-2S ferredoxin [Hydrogenophaga crassostreae]|uniref:2Fe-2S ferredoxin n=1 Tax=Hydrogenophaga crassostreae TaxID=1763535 RepID=A0A167IWN7_9BURK|nr:Rieske 2Fe-2S domain-containing protein [Hydrogenophaga crassostreae]AOW14261.1 2Fe-2S ferredoxin [Hydrogenophaga crassostreae]OAD43716.1 2Fe-2S ferredoxin [Hydrogenophaga crassostreae]